MCAHCSERLCEIYHENVLNVLDYLMMMWSTEYVYFTLLSIYHFYPLLVVKLLENKLHKAYWTN